MLASKKLKSLLMDGDDGELLLLLGTKLQCNCNDTKKISLLLYYLVESSGGTVQRKQRWTSVSPDSLLSFFVVIQCRMQPKHQSEKRTSSARKEYQQSVYCKREGVERWNA